MSRKSSLDTLKHLAVVTGAVVLLAACGGLDPEQGGEGFDPTLVDPVQSNPSLDPLRAQTYDEAGNPLLYFAASTIDTCKDYDEDLRQQFCVLHDRCPALCAAAGYALLRGPAAQGCASAYQASCVCTCLRPEAAPPAGRCGDDVGRANVCGLSDGGYASKVR